MPDKLEYIRELLKSCFVPELNQDLDSVPIDSEDFSEFQEALQLALPVLYDFVQQNEKWIFLNDEKETQEVHACLIILLCEITPSTGAVYKIKNEDLLQNANRLLRRHTQLHPEVEELLFSHYESKLRKDCWKRQLGAVHGFMRFLEFRHNEGTRNVCKMSSKWLTFCLSVGLNVRECHEPMYKQIGTRIFQIMLNHAVSSTPTTKYSRHIQTPEVIFQSGAEIQELNVHSVIYDAVFKDIHSMESVVATADIWSCLCKCLEYYRDIDSLCWSRVDDMMEALIRNISLAPDSLISICLLKFITKLCCYFSSNRSEIEKKYNADLTVQSALEDCRFTCGENSSYTIFRWAKSVLNMFITESYKLMQSTSICRQLLQEMHRCYMVCILPITLEVVEPLLLTFYEKFTAVLMEVIDVQKRDHHIVKLIRCILETFYMQLQRHSDCDDSRNLTNYRQAFKNLLTQPVFG